MNVKKILIPTDFSPFSERLIDYVKDFFGAGLPKIEILHVLMKEPPILTIRSLDLTEERVKQSILSEAEEQMDEFIKKVSDRIGCESCKNIRQGVEYQEIISFAEENEIDLIVIATHGRTGLLHTLIGSVTEKVVRYSRVPVLVVNSEFLLKE